MPVAGHRRWLGAALAGTLTLVGVVGLGHLPGVRQRLLGAGSCPLGYGAEAGAVDREAGRAAANAQLRGAAPSPARPSLGFALDGTDAPQVRAWVAAAGGTCSGHGALDLECALPRPAARPDGDGEIGAGTLFFAFSGSGRLLRVRASEQVADADTAVARLRAAAGGLTAALGQPSATTGAMEPAYLGAGALRQARLTYAFSDYRAEVHATHMGGLGYFVLSQTYQSLVD